MLNILVVVVIFGSVRDNTANVLFDYCINIDMDIIYVYVVGYNYFWLQYRRRASSSDSEYHDADGDDPGRLQMRFDWLLPITTIRNDDAIVGMWW